MEKIMFDAGLDAALDIIRERLDFYKKKEDNIIDGIIFMELEVLAKEIEDRKYYREKR